MIQSVDRAIRILKALSAGLGRLGVSELSARLGLAKGTVHGLLRTLQEHGFVGAARGQRQVPAGAGAPSAEQQVPRPLRAPLALARLGGAAGHRANEAVRVGALHGDGILIVHHVFRPDASLQILEVGEMLPLHATALGKAVRLSRGRRAGGPRRRRAAEADGPHARHSCGTASRARLDARARLCVEREEAVIGEAASPHRSSTAGRRGRRGGRRRPARARAGRGQEPRIGRAVVEAAPESPAISVRRAGERSGLARPRRGSADSRPQQVLDEADGLREDRRSRSTLASAKE